MPAYVNGKNRSVEYKLIKGASTMSDLVVIEFDNEQAAFDMRAEVAKLQKEYLIKMEDVVVVTKNEKG